MNKTIETIGTTLDPFRHHPSCNAWKKLPAREICDTARIAKLLEEVGELLLCETKEETATELSDCFIILCDIAYCNRIDMESAIADKLEMLKEKWS